MTARGIHIMDYMIHLCGEIRSVYAMSELREISGVSMSLDPKGGLRCRVKDL